MPESLDVQIADAVAAGISAAVYSVPHATIEAIAEDEPDYDGVDARQLRCSVICVGSSISPHSRFAHLIDYQAGVILARHVTTQAERNALRLLRQEVADVIRSAHFTLPDGVKFMTIETGDVYLQDALTSRNLFQAKIMAQYSVVRDKLAPPV